MRAEARTGGPRGDAAPAPVLRPALGFAGALLVALMCLGPVGAAAQEGPDGGPAATYLLRAGLLVDPQTGEARRGESILVRDGIMAEIGPDVRAPAGVPVLDLSGQAVMPGLMDAHTHLAMRIPPGTNSMDWTIRTSAGARAIIGVMQARERLMAGWTTIRDIGNAGNYVDTDLRRAVEDGLIPGPTIINAGRIIAPYGGQYELPSEHPELGEPEYRYADSHDDMVRAVRENVHFGAGVIKIVVDDQPYIYSAADIRVIVEEAANGGVPVAAHVLTEQGARNAIEGGVASLEHAWTMSDEALRMARDAGVAMVTSDFTTSVLEAYGWPEARRRAVRVSLNDRLRRAYAAGVDVVFGSDLIFQAPEGDRGTWAIEQIGAFVEAGATPLQILRSLTTNPAKLLRVDGERGALRPGQAADLIAVPRDPLQDVMVLREVCFVMKDGRVVRHDTTCRNATP